MNSFPQLPQTSDTVFTPRFGMVERLASNGAVRLRVTQSAAKYDIDLRYDMLTQADRNTLMAFYVANATIPFLFSAVEDGIQRIMVFNAKGPDVTSANGGLYTAIVSLREV